MAALVLRPVCVRRRAVLSGGDGCEPCRSSGAWQLEGQERRQVPLHTLHPWHETLPGAGGSALSP